MKPIMSIIIAAVLLASRAHAETITFDDLQVGAPPTGWIATQTGKGAAKWAVVQDDSAPSASKVLKQFGEATYSVCIKKDTKIQDGFVEVKFKPVSGREDQAGGIVWRAQDANNYYVVRANANEDNVTLYKTVNGKRSPLDIAGRRGGYGVDEKVASGKWHTLRIEFAGNRFKTTFDGKPLFEVDDGTFTEAGMVGVWTKSDSVTLFDDFSYGTATGK